MILRPVSQSRSYIFTAADDETQEGSEDSREVSGRLVNYSKVRKKPRNKLFRGDRHRCDAAGRAAFVAQTIDFRFFSGRTLTTVRAGLALNIVSSPVKGLMPLRALVAGL